MSKGNLKVVTGKEKFTPGPWVFTPPGPSDSKGMGICALWGEPGSVEQIANNHLISAAPEMYDLLNSIENDADQIPTFLWDKIQSVLSKARGDE